jgi:tRNA (Thr-GGU) A37 N-methylase
MKFSIKFVIESEFDDLTATDREQVISDMREDIEEVLARYRGAVKGFESFSAGILAT